MMLKIKSLETMASERFSSTIPAPIRVVKRTVKKSIMSENKPQSRSGASSSDSGQVRLNKFISDTGYCSRREADKLIEQGRVLINGQLPEMGMKVGPDDEVQVDDKPLRRKEPPIYIALNKPAGITCTTERHVEGNIVDFIGHRKRIFPIGRLDKASDGLIFMTNDGDIVNKILRAGNSHEKEYVVRVNKPVTQAFLDKMASGVEILDTVTLPCQVSKETTYSFRIVLTQGLNRQIRRMCEALDYEVYKLRRVRIMNITIDGLPNGKWRYLTDVEMVEIYRLLAQSSKTEEASRISGQGESIAKATDAKLYDARQQRKDEPAVKYKTYHGKGEVDRRRSGSQPGKSHGTRSDSQQRSHGAKPGGQSARGPRRSRQDDASQKPASPGIKKWKSKKEQD